MRTGIAILVILLVGASARADVKSQSVQIGGIGILTGVAQKDGSSLIVKQTHGGPCVARVAANAVDTKCYGPADENNGGLIAFADDGYVIYGSSFQGEQSVESGFLFRVDAKGNLKWARRYGSSGSIGFRSAAVAKDGSVVVAGYAGTFPSAPFGFGRASFVMKVDRDGRIAWQRIVDVSGSEAFMAVCALTDGFSVVSSTEFGGVIYRLRANGDTVWRAVVSAGLASIAPIGGDFIVAGGITERGRDEDWLARFDRNGKMLWQRVGSDISSGIVAFVDERGEVTAYKSVAQPGSNDALALLRFRADGSIASLNLIAYPHPEAASQVSFTPDGGLLTVVDRGDAPAGLYQIDRSGGVPACLTASPLRESFHTLSPTPSINQPIEESRGTVTERPQQLMVAALTSSIAAGCGTQAPSTPAVAVVSTEPAAQSIDVDAFRAEVTHLMEARDFAALDRIGARLRTGRERFSNGVFKAREFYWTVTGEQQDSPNEQKILRFMDDWLRAMPSSPTAAIAAANAYQDFAWLARGQGIGGTVTSAAQEKFDRYLTRAKSILDAAATTAAGDPEYDMIRAGVSGPLSCDDIQQFAHDRTIVSRAYFPTLVTIANYLLPRWCGSAEQYRQFAEFAAASAPADVADETYGRLGLSALETEERSDPTMKTKFFGEYRFDWTRMRRGLLDHQKKYPMEASLAHEIAWAAWKAGDRETAKQFFERPALAWTPEMANVWTGSAYYDQAREWALKKPVEPFVQAPSTPAPAPEGGDWIKTAGSQWPPIILRNTVRLQDGTTVSDFNSFLVQGPSGIVAVTALNRLDVRRSVFGRTQQAPIYLSELKARLVSWTMTSTVNTTNTLTVTSIEPRPINDEQGSKVRGAVLRFKNPTSTLPVRVLKQRGSPTRMHLRGFVVGCQTGISPCKQAVFSVEFHGRMPMSRSGSGTFAFEFEDQVDWRQFIGSPVLDEDGLVVGVIAEEYPAMDPSMAQPNQAMAEEVAFLLETPVK